MTALEQKYGAVITAAQSAGVTNLQVSEQNGVLRITGNASSSAAKDQVWNALGAIDPTYSASDVQVDVQVSGLGAGAQLTVATEESNLNIRQQPSTDAPVVGKAAKGETVKLVEQTNADWWKIQTNSGEEGYAYARYLKA